MSWAPAILLALAAAAVLFIAVTLLPAMIVKRRLISELQQKSRGYLALTFDDGPGPLLTPPLLKLLAAHRVKVTFFLVGFRAERDGGPQAADAIAAAGHEIGNHTHWHRHAWRTLPWLAVRDVHDGYRSMSRWMKGDAPFRPPFGKLTSWTLATARKRRAPLSFWTCDGADTWTNPPDPQAIADQVARAGGAVVLLHSHDRGDDRQAYVLAVTEYLLRTARERNLRLCTMSEMLSRRPPSDLEGR